MPVNAEMARARGVADPAAGLSHELAVALVDVAPDGILVVDEAGRIVYVNRRTEELFGCGAGDLLGHAVDELLPERLREAHRAHRARYLHQPRVRAMGAGLALWGRRLDGSEFPVEISLSPLKTQNGLEVIAVVRDVTARVAAETEQREVREILDATRDAVSILDADSLQFVYVNQGAVEQFGYRRDELLGMTMPDITPKLGEQELRALLAPLERGDGASITFTTVHRRRDGSEVPVEIVMQAVGEDARGPRRYVKIARDISERLTAEERLRRAQQHLRVVEDRERIARDLHDIVIQKLFAAGMALQGVWSRTEDPEQARRLSGVVDELDETIREIRAAIFSLHDVDHGAGGLRADILGVVDEQRAGLGFEPRLRFEGPVDTIDDVVAVELLAVLRESLSNIVRHAGASAAEVLVDCRDDVTLRVCDDGLGMAPSITPGNGIRNLEERAARLDGSFRIAARPGGGSEVEWRVPRR
jgi:PAS domain S-box-containing protein